MDNLKASIILFPLLLTILLVSCSTPKALEYRDFRNFSVEKLGFSSSSVRMDLVYFNPNSFGLQLNRTDLDIYLDSNYLGRTSQEHGITIPRKAEFIIPIKMDIDMKNLLKNGFITIFRNEIKVKVNGTVKVGKANVFKSFPVNYEGMQTFSVF